MRRKSWTHCDPEQRCRRPRCGAPPARSTREGGFAHSVASNWNAVPWPVRVLVLLMAAIVPLVLVWRARPNIFHEGLSGATSSRSVAILPLVDQGSDGQMNALAKSMTLRLTNDLTQVSGLKVSSQATARDLGDAN